jgi:hypothetical protein
MKNPKISTIKGKFVLVCGRVIIIKKAIALYDKRIPMNLITQTLLVINNATVLTLRLA